MKTTHYFDQRAVDALIERRLAQAHRQHERIVSVLQMKIDALEVDLDRLRTERGTVKGIMHAALSLVAARARRVRRNRSPAETVAPSPVD